MKKVLYLATALMLLNAAGVSAAPGDTTWVQANIAQLSWNGNYDSTVTFPAAGTPYRRIYMIFTLGKYVCPGSPTYCGDWDYTVNNYLMTPGGDTLELGRLITPYANASAPRTPWSWTQRYVYDVTDYAPLLHGSATIRIGYSGYSGGFTGNVKFMFIEGTPDRDVIAVQRLWHGYWGYGDTTHHDSNNINVHLPYLDNTAPALTQSAEMKVTVTGHGSDANYCCEFMPHTYGVFLNAAKIDSYLVWRANCGMNELYPQSGTWIYDRSNWCPGAMVYDQHYRLPVTAGNPANVDIQFEPYIGSGGGYGIDGTLFFYKGMNKTLDASLDRIIAPSNDENHFRENPLLGAPVIHVKNTGANTIASITFEYQVAGYPAHTFNWSGSISSLDETDITLGQLPELNLVAGGTGLQTFTCRILTVNGTTDDDATNNTASSQFVPAPVWPSQIKMLFRTNSEAIAPSSTICETSWIIYDVNDNIYAQRTNATINKLYTDTVTFVSGLYKLVIYDSSCDGLQWWALNGQPGYTTGYLSVKKMTNATIPMNGYVYSGTFNNDFGCGFTQYFFSGDQHVGVDNITAAGVAMAAFPNPASDEVTIELTGLPHVNGRMSVVDMLGHVVYDADCSTTSSRINLNGYASGAYTVIFTNKDNGNKLQTRVMVTK